MIELELVLEGRVTEECLSLYNVDGSMRKTAKSKLLDLFNRDPVAENPTGHISLVDMGLIWRLATPTPEDCEARKRDGSAGVTTWIRSALLSFHAMLMHTSSSLSTTSMTFPSASRMMSMIDGQQNIHTFQMFSPSQEIHSQELLSSTNSWSDQETRSACRSLGRNS